VNQGTPAASQSQAIAGRCRVAILGTFNQACGVAAHTAQMRDGLVAAARRRGVALDVLVLAEETESPLGTDPACVRRCWSRQRFDMTRALDVLARERVDVLHVQFHGDLFVNTDLPGFLRACREQGIRLYGSFHFLEQHAEFAAAAINLLDRSFVHAEHGAARFVAHGAHAGRLKVLPLGVSASNSATSMREARRVLDLPGDLELVTSWGSFQPDEGVLEILRALPEVTERHPQVQFAFLGGGAPDQPGRAEYIQECRDAVASLGLEHHVMLPEDSLSDELAGPYLAASDVVVLNYAPARQQSAAAAAFVLAHGRPVITTATPAFAPLRTVALQPPSGADLARSISRVLEDAKLSARLEGQVAELLERSFYLRLGEVLLGEYGVYAGDIPAARATARELFEVALEGTRAEQAGTSTSAAPGEATCDQMHHANR
jgi:glycosyltransferase involved in cell wall biosynthesis